MCPTFTKMLADRSYMRSDYPRGSTSALVWMIALTIASFVMQLILGSPWFAQGEKLLDQLPLTVSSVQDGKIWTLLTHGLLHSTNTPFHILFTVLSLIFVGRELEPLLGPRRFVGLFVGGLVLGALTWTAVHWNQGGVHIGASAGIFALFLVLALLYPNQEINFLVFFLVPVRVRPITLVYVLIAIDAFGLLFYELRGNAPPFGYAASAHLGGMAAGWLYFRFVHANQGMDRAPEFTFQWPTWLRRSAKPAPSQPTVPTKAVRATANLRAEVDRILDKINSKGFGSLTDEEKRILDDAKDTLSHQ
jgi:membrane associated rhomboid family serine protease